MNTTEPPKVNSSTAMILGIVVLVIAAISAIVVLALFGDPTNETILVASVLGFVAPTLASLLALAKGGENQAAISSLSTSVNGRMEQLVAQARQLGHTTGIVEGATAAMSAQKTTTDSANLSSIANDAATIATNTATAPSMGTPP